MFARDLVDTDDLTQDVMLRTLDRVKQSELGADSLVYYLRAAVMNRIRDEVRLIDRRPKLRQEPLEFHRDLQASPLEQAMGNEQLRRYEDALHSLPARERDAVILRIELGFPFDQIATALGWTGANAARMAIVRAVGKMAKQIGHG